MKKINLSGKKFSRLTCSIPHDTDIHGNVIWACSCECGGSALVRTRDLLNGHTKSCGCLKLSEFHRQYGRLEVLGEVKKSKNGRRVLCRCECGNEKIVLLKNLKSGNVQSCGCLRRDTKTATTHGLSRKSPSEKTRLFRIWTGMKTRCYNVNDKSYVRYGGRGITVCEEWLNFKIFHDWAIQNGYKEELTIERIDNDSGYSPDNCTWITRGEQALNRGNTKLRKALK